MAWFCGMVKVTNSSPTATGYSGRGVVMTCGAQFCTFGLADDVMLTGSSLLNDRLRSATGRGLPAWNMATGGSAVAASAALWPPASALADVGDRQL